MTLAERGDHTVKARNFSGNHKARTIKELVGQGLNIVRFFEDDPIQLDIIKQAHPTLETVHVVSSLVVK